jgi:hypothetical protein
LALYDVSTLHFETDTADGFREPGFSKERRLEPQITIGLLTDAAGFPLMVEAFEGNRAETTTVLPTIRAFMAAHQLGDVTTVADAGMISDGNRRAIEAVGLSFILGARNPDEPPPSLLQKLWSRGTASTRQDQRSGRQRIDGPGRVADSTQPRCGRTAAVGLDDLNLYNVRLVRQYLYLSYRRFATRRLIAPQIEAATAMHPPVTRSPGPMDRITKPRRAARTPKPTIPAQTKPVSSYKPASRYGSNSSKSSSSIEPKPPR